MVYKLSLAIILAFLFLGNVIAQKTSNEDIPEEIKAKIQEKVEREILWYRAALCPEVDFERFVTRGYANNIIIARRNPKEVFLSDSVPNGQSWQDYKMIMEIKHWPEGNPKLNSYLVKKQDLKFTNGNDTISLDICNGYFAYDEDYVVYYKEDGIPQMISGNVFQDISYPFINKLKEVRLVEAHRLVEFRLAQFNKYRSNISPFEPYETDDYFQFKVDKSLLSRKSVLVKVPKADPFNTIELLYYTNDTTITKEDIYGLYEVKYTLKSKPETYEETLPVITKMDRQFINEKIRNESKAWADVAYFIEMPSIIREETVTIKGKIDTVYYDKEEPLIIVVDGKGEKTKFVNEEAVRYIIKGKGKRQVLVKESGEIVYKED